MMKKSRWMKAAEVLIVFFLIVLFINAYVFFVNVKKETSRNFRSYGLDIINQYFDEGDYQQVYLYTLANKYAEDEPSVDVSQYEAFGRYYHYYVEAMTHEDNEVYLEKMEKEKELITWKKILSVIESLENDMNESE